VSFEFLTDKQRDAWESYQKNEIIFLTGPAGTGKSFLATAFAIKDILSKTRRKIILTRPIVEAGESLGYLPGDFNEKVGPYMRPLYDCYHYLCPGATIKNKIIEGAFEIAPLAYMRGRTFDDSVCVLDEAQNCTESQIKLFLTRLGKNSKMIVTGDPRQSDLRDRAGMVGIMDRLADLEGIGIVKFVNSEIVRHSLVGKILERLE
jgi:phosphate starvation-inducible PhoH-like protein